MTDKYQKCKYPFLFFGIDICVSEFNRLIGDKWLTPHGLEQLGRIEERLIAIGRIIHSIEQEAEIIAIIENLTEQKNGEFSFSPGESCGYYMIGEKDENESKNNT